MALTGLGLFAAPGVVLNLLGLPIPSDQWVRVLGALALVLGYYYWTSGSRDLVAFFEAPKQLLLIGLVDLLGAAWTAAGLRKAAAR